MPETEQRARLLAFAARHAPAPSRGEGFLKLKGDASNRSYYRVGAEPSYIVMEMPASAKASEEKTGGALPTELPFVNVHRYLSALKVRVPTIHFYDEPAGLMLLEDLGDRTFEAALLQNPSKRAELYGTAIDLLAALRARAERSTSAERAGCIAFERAFDVTLFDWELHHFREWGLEARGARGAQGGTLLSPTERAELDGHFKALATQLAAEPRGFTHRDYQSRNLMLPSDDGLAVIDFQDALLGPRQYDLVALLRDSYVELERPFIEAQLDRYLHAYRAAGGIALEREAFIQCFDLLTVQRKLKDAGRFEFIARVKGNPGFLPYVEPSLRYVRDALARLPSLANLRALLARHTPELR